MKRITLIAVAALLAAGCSVNKYANHRNANPYANPFYAKYLNPQVPLDAAIQRDIDSLRANPNSAPTHNELGQLLVQKGFPKDAETEFERAVNVDKRFYPAWYNLGMARAARGETTGARFAFGRALHYKPGDSWTLFQTGLLEEQRGDFDGAIDHYAKAILKNHSLLDPKVNPRVLDSKWIHLALIRAYPTEHTRETMLFQGTPPGYVGAAPALTDPSKQAPKP